MSVTNKIVTRLARAILAGWMTLGAFPGMSQTVSPSQITPQSLRPPANSQNGDVILPESAGFHAPSGAEQLQTVIGTVLVEGSFPELQEQTRKLKLRLEGKQVSVAEIYAAANDLEHGYARAGFVLARVAVPPQKLVNGGTVRLVIVDGFIEDIDVRGVPGRERGVVPARLASLNGLRHVTLDEIERRLLLAGDVPGLSLKSALARGSSDGGARLLLDGKQRYITGSLGGDDRLEHSLGVWEANASVSLQSVFGLGEQIYGSLAVGTNLTRLFEGHSPLEVYGGGFVLPVGHAGFSINPEYTLSTTRPSPPAGTPASKGVYERYALRAAYPFVKLRRSTLSGLASFEYIRQRVEAIQFGTYLNRDYYGVLRIGPEYATTLPWGSAFEGSLTLSRGLGGRTEADAAGSSIPLSRLGAAPEFNKLSGGARFSQGLPGVFRLDLNAAVQTSFDKAVLRSEQFSLDGIDALSAFYTGAFTVDQGMTFRAAVARPFARGFETSGARATFSPYLFGAIGYGDLVQPTAVEQKRMTAGSYGVGLQTGLETHNNWPTGSLGVEAGRQYSDVPGRRAGWRANVYIGTRF